MRKPTDRERNQGIIIIILSAMFLVAMGANIWTLCNAETATGTANLATPVKQLPDRPPLFVTAP